MQTIPNYSSIKQLYASTHIEIYRCLRLADHKKVILKIPAEAEPSKDIIAGIQHEYNLLKKLDIPGVVRVHELLKTTKFPVLVLEDMEGISLEEYLAKKPVELDVFFMIALQLATIINELHQHNIIHKDIKPANIIIDPATHNVKLIDLSISSVLREESQEDINPNLLEGTPVYLSPEQTGRTNRPIDYRTDFYSLGITFFEMLTGKLPFQAEDILGIIHAHLAVQPPLVSDINPKIPVMLAKIVQKLLAKIPEQRYTSATGLKADLSECAKQWQQIGDIKPFNLGTYDINDHLLISSKLYGRSHQVEQLLNAFQQVSQGKTKLVIVTGYAGIGKTSLVKEVNPPITRLKGHFIHGKYDQLQRNKPYSAISQAFGELIKQLLTESETVYVQFKQELQSALGNIGQVIIDVIPNLEQIIGPQPHVPQLDNPNENQNRFIVAFESFIQVFTKQQYPLVIFLDDLQWADSASLKLLESMMLNPANHYLLIICAYRSNEVRAHHPVKLTEQSLEKAGVELERIVLQPLSQVDISELLANTLNHDVIKVKPLAQLVADKTEGNPYFINEFLKSLYLQHLLYFSFENNQWEWKLEEIQKQSATANIINLLTEKLLQLDMSTQQILKFACCIGYKFDLRTLVTISELSPSEVVKLLHNAVNANLIHPINTNYKLFYDEEKANAEIFPELEAVEYQFNHDQIQQTVYQLIPKEQLGALHFKIGNLLLSKKSLDEWKESSELFELLNNFNYSLNIIPESLKKTLIVLNTEAGRRAKASASYALSVTYFEAALKLIDEREKWNKQYKSSFQLFKELAESEYLIGNFDKAEQYLNLLLEKTTDDADKIAIYNLKATVYLNLNYYMRGIHTALQALKLIGSNLSEKPPRIFALKEIILIKWREIKWKILGKKIEDVDLPIIQDPKLIAASHTFYLLQFMSYQANENLAAVILCKLVNFYFKYGVSPYIADAPLVYNYIQITGLEKFKTIEKYNLLSQKGVAKLNYNPLAVCKNLQLMGIFINHWYRPAKFDLDLLNETYQKSLEIGNLVFADYCLTVNCLTTYCVGKPLSDVFGVTNQAVAFSKQTSRSIFYPPVVLQRYLIHILEGNKKVTEYDLDAVLEKIIVGEDKTGAGCCCMLRCSLFFLMGDYKNALRLAQKSFSFRPFIKGLTADAETLLYYSLTMIKLYKEATPKEKRNFKKLLKSFIHEFALWSKACPVNYKHKYLIILAEQANLYNKKEEAQKLYDQAIAAAMESEYLHMIAIFNELAAIFNFSQGKIENGEKYLAKAHEYYRKWGGLAKCELLERQYSQFINP